jgi:hypothetical protein
MYTLVRVSYETHSSHFWICQLFLLLPSPTTSSKDFLRYFHWAEAMCSHRGRYIGAEYVVEYNDVGYLTQAPPLDLPVPAHYQNDLEWANCIYTHMNSTPTRCGPLQIPQEKLSLRTIPPEHRFSGIVKNSLIENLIKLTGMDYHMSLWHCCSAEHVIRDSDGRVVAYPRKIYFGHQVYLFVKRSTL